MSALISRTYPLKSFRTVRQKTACVHLSLQGVQFAVESACQQATATCLPTARRSQTKLNAANAANLKELGYGE